MATFRVLTGSLLSALLIAGCEPMSVDGEFLFDSDEYALETVFAGVELAGVNRVSISPYNRSRWYTSTPEGAMTTFSAWSGKAPKQQALGQLENVKVLDWAFHPNFRSERFVFVAYLSGNKYRVSKFAVVKGGRTLENESELVLAEEPEAPEALTAAMTFDTQGHLVVATAGEGETKGRLFGRVVATQETGAIDLGQVTTAPISLSKHPKDGLLVLEKRGLFRLRKDAEAERLFELPEDVTPVGGTLYNGKLFPDLVGKYVFVDTSAVFAVALEAGSKPERLIESEGVVGVSLDQDNEVVLVKTDGLVRLVPAPKTERALEFSAAAPRAVGQTPFEKVTAVLTKNCGACHMNRAMGGFSMGATTAPKEFVAAAESTDCKGLSWKRVVPGKPEKSLLYKKITDQNVCGSPMPEDGSVISEEDIEIIRAWIEAGAPGITGK